MRAVTGLAGRLDTRVALQRASITADGATSWTSFATVWAAVEVLGGGEMDRALHMEGAVRRRLTLRWRDDVTSADRAVLGGRALRIVAAFDPDGGRRRLVLETEEDGR